MHEHLYIWTNLRVILWIPKIHYLISNTIYPTFDYSLIRYKRAFSSRGNIVAPSISSAIKSIFLTAQLRFSVGIIYIISQLNGNKFKKSASIGFDLLMFEFKFNLELYRVINTNFKWHILCICWIRIMCLISNYFCNHIGHFSRQTVWLNKNTNHVCKF